MLAFAFETLVIVFLPAAFETVAIFDGVCIRTDEFGICKTIWLRELCFCSGVHVSMYSESVGCSVCSLRGRRMKEVTMEDERIFKDFRLKILLYLLEWSWIKPIYNRLGFGLKEHNGRPLAIARPCSAWPSFHEQKMMKKSSNPMCCCWLEMER